MRPPHAWNVVCYRLTTRADRTTLLDPQPVGGAFVSTDTSIDARKPKARRHCPANRESIITLLGLGTGRSTITVEVALAQAFLRVLPKCHRHGVWL
jgi:hypothetical protein